MSSKRAEWGDNFSDGGDADSLLTSRAESPREKNYTHGTRDAFAAEEVNGSQQQYDDDGSSNNNNYDDSNNNPPSSIDFTTLTPPPLNLHQNSLQSRTDSLPFPYSLIDTIIRDVIVEEVWKEVEVKERQLGRGSKLEEEEEEEKRNEQLEEGEYGISATRLPTAASLSRKSPSSTIPRVTYAVQPPLTSVSSITSLLTATPNRVVAPAAAASSSSSSSTTSTLQLNPISTAISRNGLLSVIATVQEVYVVDLERGFSIVGCLPVLTTSAAAATGNVAAASTSSPTSIPSDAEYLTSLCLSPTPVLRGDEHTSHSQIGKEEYDATTACYLIAYATSRGVVKVLTVNVERKEVYEGCSIVMQIASHQQRIVNMNFSDDCTFLSVTSVPIVSPTQSTSSASSTSPSNTTTTTIYSLHPHRYDIKLEPPKLTQKEILSQVRVDDSNDDGGDSYNIDGENGDDSSSSSSSSSGGEHRRFKFLTPQQKLYTARIMLKVEAPKYLTAPTTSGSKIAAGAVSGVEGLAQVQESKQQNDATSSRRDTIPGAQQQSTITPTAASTSTATTKSKKRSSGKFGASTNGAAADSNLNNVAMIDTATLTTSILSSSSSSTNPLPYILFPLSSLIRSVHQSQKYQTRSVLIGWKGDMLLRMWDLEWKGVIEPGMSGSSGGGVMGAMAVSNATNDTSRTNNGTGASSSGNGTSKKGASEKAQQQQQQSTTSISSNHLDLTSFTSSTSPPSRPPYHLSSPLTTLCLDTFSQHLLAVAMENGSCVVYDLRVAGVKYVVNAMPILAGGSGASTSAAITPAATTSITSMCFYQQSHLLLGCADQMLRVIALPSAVLSSAATQSKISPLPACTILVSTRLPGRIVSVNSGFAVKLAVVGVQVASTPNEEQLHYFAYDFISNFIVGKIAAGESITSSSQSPAAFDLNSTDKFIVHHNRGSYEDEKESSSQSPYYAPSPTSSSASSYNRVNVPPILRAFSSAPIGGQQQQQQQQQQQHGAVASAISFHSSLRLQQSYLSSVQNTSQVCLLSASSSSSSSSTLLLYSLPDLLLSYYPAVVTSCPNAFLRQQHLLSWYSSVVKHADRLQHNSFSQYLEQLNRQEVEGGVRGLHEKYVGGRMGGVSEDGGGGNNNNHSLLSPHSRHNTNRNSNSRAGSTTINPAALRKGFHKSTLSHISDSQFGDGDGSYQQQHGGSGVLPSLLSPHSLHSSHPNSGHRTHNSISGRSFTMTVGSTTRSQSVFGGGSTFGGKSKRSSNTQSKAGSRAAGGSHASSASIVALLPPDPFSTSSQQHDVSHLVHEQLAHTLQTCQERSQQVKMRRIELQAALKQQKILEEQRIKRAARWQLGTTTGMTRGFPPITLAR